MMANNDMSRWCVLYTAPKSERKLVQRLHAAGSYSRSGKDRPKKCLHLCSPTVFL